MDAPRPLPLEVSVTCADAAQKHILHSQRDFHTASAVADPGPSVPRPIPLRGPIGRETKDPDSACLGWARISGREDGPDAWSSLVPSWPYTNMCSMTCSAPLRRSDALSADYPQFLAEIKARADPLPHVLTTSN